MTPEEIRLECLSLAAECREARHSAADVVALAAAFEMYVKELPAKPLAAKAPARKAAIKGVPVKALDEDAEDGE
jgi:hypothetical protein